MHAREQPPPKKWLPCSMRLDKRETWGPIVAEATLSVADGAVDVAVTCRAVSVLTKWFFKLPSAAAHAVKLSGTGAVTPV